MTTPPLNLRPLTPPPGPDVGSPSSSSFSYESSPHLYLFTSLTAGSSHIITATSRMETILKANRIPFKAVDCATDEKARRIWSRRAGKRKLPGLVKQGMILADLELVEEWNEFGEIKDELGGDPLPAKQVSTAPATKDAPPAPEQPQSSTATPPAAAPSASKSTQMSQQQQLAQEVAAIAAQRAKPKSIPIRTPTVTATESEDPSATTLTARSPPRAELDQDVDIDQPAHNTSTHAGLPPLSTSAKSPPKPSTPSTGDLAVDETNPADNPTSNTSTPFIQSPDLPKAPPPTAIEPTPPPSQLSFAQAVPEEVDLAKSPAVVKPKVNPAPTGQERRRGSSISEASPEEVAAIELRDSIPEVSAEQEAALDEDYLNAKHHGPEFYELDGANTPLCVSYGDGYTKEDYENEDCCDDDDDDTTTASGQFIPSAADDTEDGRISPRILRNDPNRHIKFTPDTAKPGEHIRPHNHET